MRPVLQFLDWTAPSTATTIDRPSYQPAIWVQVLADTGPLKVKLQAPPVVVTVNSGTPATRRSL